MTDKKEANLESLRRAIYHDAKTIQKQRVEIDGLKDKLEVAGKMLEKAPILASHHEVLNLAASVRERLRV